MRQLDIKKIQIYDMNTLKKLFGNYIFVFEKLRKEFYTMF